MSNDKMDGFTLQLVGCPQCSAPAEVTDRFVLESTSGPVEHLTVCCLNRHRFTLLAERLTSDARNTLTQPDDAAQIG